MRIVSLISSATEILCQLGLRDQIVGISHECDFPSNVKGLPIVSSTRINPEKSGGEIAKSVLDIVGQGLSLYEVKKDLLRSLNPDLIVTQTQCEVCAVSLKDVEDAVRDLTGINTEICSLHPNSIDDICKDIRRVAEATGTQERAEEVITEFWIRLNQVNARAGTHKSYRPKVLVLEWLDPVIVAGAWLPELVTLAGADPLIVTHNARFQTVSWETIHQTNPDVVVALPCGYPLTKTLEEMWSSPIRENLLKIPAVTKGHAYACDGNQYFNRPGPRITDSLELLAGLISPNTFSDHYEHFLNIGGFSPWRPL